MDLELDLPVDYKPSAGEINNIVYSTLKYTINWAMRACDLGVCVMMAGGAEAIVGNAGVSKLVEVTCEYAWDHLSGEPDEFTAEQLFEHMKPCFHEFYKNFTVEERSDTTPIS